MAQPRKPKGMLADQRLSACRRTVDMVGKFTFMATTTTFEDVINPDHTKTVEDQSPSQAAYLVCPQEATSDAVEPETGGIEGISNNVTVPTTIATTTTTMQENQHVDTIADRKSYRVAFLTNRAELGSYSTSTREKETSVATWLSQVRRRCLNIRNWMPKMCSCVDNNPAFSGRAAARVGNYQRLGSRANDSGFHRQQPTPGTSYDDDTDEYYYETADEDAKHAEQLSFYFDDNTCNTLLVEKNLRAIDLCQLLKVKRNVSGISWSIMETWPELGIERTLEDHEDILAVHKEMKLFTPRHVRKFIFRADLLKYQHFRKHRQEFIAENTVTSVVNGPGEIGGKLIDAETALRTNLLYDDAECPQIFSLAWVRNGYYDMWRKVYLLLRDRKLYISNKLHGRVPKRPPFGYSLDVHWLRHRYWQRDRITTAKSRFNSPFEWGICLRRSCNTEAENTVSGESGLKIVTFHTEKSYVFWLTAMRFAKYGKQLRENYKAFKNRQCEQTNGEHQKEQYANVHEPIRSRVAMDFTGSVGRIVEDPKEAKDIAESEGMSWRRTWKPFSRLAAPPNCGMARCHGLDEGVHVLEPWFHRGLNRDIAAGIIRDHSSVDGVFLVRDSKSNVGAYVLTYKFSDKVFHAQIQPVFDERSNCWLYTIDKGITKFYDLMQLVIFYELNAGCLPTRLTRYVQNGITAPPPRPEDGGASPSSSEPCVRFSAIPTVVVNTTNCSSHSSI